jgi:CRISPR/Cas system-associated protein Cas10 (large subunit of type III CRISPR-Cas system)
MIVIGVMALIVSVGCAERIYSLSKRIKELERRMQNSEVEIFAGLAEAEVEKGKFKKRVTMRGIVEMLVKLNKEKMDYLTGKKSEQKPIIHRV